MMPIMRRIAVLMCLLTVAVPGAGACAAPGTTQAGTWTTPDDTPSAAATWAMYAAEVSGVKAGPGAKPVTVQVEAPTGPDCFRNVRVSNPEEENGVIFADIVEDLAPSAAIGDCPAGQPSEVKLTSQEPIGNRPLSLNHEAWALKNGTYSRCDDNKGCNPPKDHCDPTWTRAAVRALDVSSHSQGTVEACDGSWLVMTVPDDPALCGAEARAGCDATTTVRRYFLKNEPSGWATVARTTSGGCDAVLKAAPTFPHKLCTDLKPTGRG
jgi:hypothetical protein